MLNIITPNNIKLYNILYILKFKVNTQNKRDDVIIQNYYKMKKTTCQIYTQK